MKEGTCKDIIKMDIAETEAQLSDFYANIENAAEEAMREDYQAILNEYAIAQDTFSVVRLTLAWGGPGIFLDVIHRHGQIQNIIYHYQDWYDGAIEYIGSDSVIWRYAEEQLEGHVLLST